MSEFDNKMMAALLLALLCLVLTVFVAMVFYVAGWRRRRRLWGAAHPAYVHFASRPSFSGPFWNRPMCWLAIKSRNPMAVQAALELSNPRPCTWTEGLSQLEERKLFISPPVNGWVLLMGSGLPEPGDDVDECFRFIMELSRKLGLVQFFQANRIVYHHAWVIADSGEVIRAYAWAGKTLWNQGPRTLAERLMGLSCYDYAQPVEHSGFGLPDAIVHNVEKVSRLAAKWSLDPAGIDERVFDRQMGIAGDFCAASPS